MITIYEKIFALWILFTLSSLLGLFKFNILFLNILLALLGIVFNSGFTGLNTIYIYVCVCLCYEFVFDFMVKGIFPKYTTSM